MPTDKDIASRIDSIRATRIAGVREDLHGQASRLLGEIGDIRRARRKGDSGAARLAEVLDTVEEWPSALRDQVLDRIGSALRVRVRA